MDQETDILDQILSSKFSEFRVDVLLYLHVYSTARFNHAFSELRDNANGYDSRTYGVSDCGSGTCTPTFAAYPVLNKQTLVNLFPEIWKMSIGKNLQLVKHTRLVVVAETPVSRDPRPCSIIE